MSRFHLLRRGRVTPSPTPTPTPTPTPSPPSSTTHNGSTPAAQPWNVQNKSELMAALASPPGDGRIILRGNGVNYCENTGSGRHIDFSRANTNIPLIIEAADYNDKPKFIGSESPEIPAPGTGWFRNCANITFKGLHIEDDNAEPRQHAICYRHGNDLTFDRCHIFGPSALTGFGNLAHPHYFMDWRGGATNLTIQNCVMHHLLRCIYVGGGTGNDNILMQYNSFLRFGEHTLKAAGGFNNWRVYRNAVDEMHPGWDGQPGDPYIDHSNFVYLGPNAGVSHDNFTAEENLFASLTDHALFGVGRHGGSGSFTSLKYLNNRIWGKMVLAYVSITGTGHEIRGNIWRGTNDGAFGEATTTGYDLNVSVVDVTGNDGLLLDRGGNTITANGPGGPNIRQGGSLAQSAAQNRAEFEAACAALGLNTTVTTGL